MEVTLKNVSMHFNKGAILTPAEKFQSKLLHKFGGAVRKTQRNSLKRGKNGQVSAIGKPPLRHSTRPDIKDTVFYFVDVKKKNVVVGMVLLSTGDKVNPMPKVLEHSGASHMRRFKGRPKRHVVKIASRPSAQPAFKKTIDKQLPDLIKGGIMKEV